MVKVWVKKYSHLYAENFVYLNLWKLSYMNWCTMWILKVDTNMFLKGYPLEANTVPSCILLQVCYATRNILQFELITIITQPSIYGEIVYFLLYPESLNYSTGQ